MAGEKEFKYIVRIANTDLNGHNAVNHALTKIKGVSFSYANLICAISKVPKRKKAGDLTDKEIDLLTDVLKEPVKYNVPKWMMNRRNDYETGNDTHLITVDMSFVKENDIKRLKKIKTYRGMRHQWGLPSRGQRTRSNFRRNKRKGGSLGVKRSPQAKKADNAKANKK